MDAAQIDVLVAGHLCLDIIPAFPPPLKSGIPAQPLLVPGKLIEVDSAVLSTGGAVSNTGLALHRLGLRTGIIGKIGDDYFGGIIQGILRQYGEQLVENLIVGKGEDSSYTIVINPPEVDRIFLHNAGVNHTFTSGEISDAALAKARLLHFGYPPLMRKFYADNGLELQTLFQRAHAHGLATSLDMSLPDPESESGQVDWEEFLRQTLPFVDIFLPSIDEILFMLHRPFFTRLLQTGEENHAALVFGFDGIRNLADRLLAMGPAVVGFKLGEQGLYLKTAVHPGRFAAMDRGSPEQTEGWANRELLTGCRRVTVAGTTGAGDCTIAGFLGALLKGCDADHAVSMAVAVGGSSVEARDAIRGVPEWEEVTGRLVRGWEMMPCGLIPKEWKKTPAENFME